MRLIRPSAELWEQGSGIEAMWKHIARCVRVCYQSTPQNNGENDEAFVRRVLFRAQPDSSPANHLAMLEHGTVYLHKVINAYVDLTEIFYEKYKCNKYSKVATKNHHFEKGVEVYDGFITTNLRVLVENGWLNDLKYLCEPTPYHEKRYTISFITNLGVSREFNRHRVDSVAEESTRFCNYSKDKFGNEVTFVLPAWYDQMTDEQKETYKSILQEAETGYMILLDKWENKVVDRRFKTGFKGNPQTPQQAREVLPLATKTQLVHTAFASDWNHFIQLRSDGVSGAPHPNAKVLGDQVKKLLEGKL